MVEENISQIFRLKNMDETRNYYLEEIAQNELMSTRTKRTKRVVQLASTIIGCISISAFASLLGIPIGIKSSAIGLKICAIVAGIKKCKLIIKKKKKNHDKIVLLSKSKLNSIEVLFSKALIVPNISHDEFVLIHNA